MCPAGGQASHVTEEAGASGHKQKRLVSACVSSRDWQLERPDSGALTDKPCSAQTHVLHQPRKNGIPPDYGDWVLKAHPQLWGGACQHKCHTGSNGLRIPKAERPHPLRSGFQVLQTHLRVVVTCVTQVPQVGLKPIHGAESLAKAWTTHAWQRYLWKATRPLLTRRWNCNEGQRSPAESVSTPFLLANLPQAGRRHKAAETQLRRNWHVAPSGPRADQVPMTYEPPSARVSHANCLPRSRTAGLKLCALRHVARVAWPGTGNKTQCVRESTSPSPFS